MDLREDIPIWRQIATMVRDNILAGVIRMRKLGIEIDKVVDLYNKTK